MSRTSRVPYHQNVYDLLGIEPGECPDAARMIEEHEAKHGPLPASVREWYLHDHLFRLYYPVEPLAQFLEQAAAGVQEENRRFADVMIGEYGRWMVYLDGANDPAVWTDAYGARGDELWQLDSERFSDFVYIFAESSDDAAIVRENRSSNWLRTPTEPFAPPILDFLTEQFGEPERTPRPGDVTTHTWHPEGGTIRVTADHPAHPEPLSAWWVHAETPEYLEQFARLLMPWGTLANTLRADTDAARAVLSVARAARTN